MPGSHNIDPTDVKTNANIIGERNSHIHRRDNHLHIHVGEIPGKNQNIGRWVETGYLNHLIIPIFFEV